MNAFFYFDFFLFFVTDQHQNLFFKTYKKQAFYVSPEYFIQYVKRVLILS